MGGGGGEKKKTEVGTGDGIISLMMALKGTITVGR